MSERTDAQGLLDELFREIGRLGEVDRAHVKDEVERAKALTGLATQVNETYANAIEAANLKARYRAKVPEIEGGQQ